MPTTVAEHYRKHLAPIYSWMVGDFNEACSAARSFYADIGIMDGAGRSALDLGCGHGVHSVALGSLGIQVHAVDTSALLLDELKLHAEGLPIHGVCDDLLNYVSQIESASLDVIVCMGDTLPHLPSEAVVEQLMEMVADKLLPGGVFAVSLRDYFTRELVGEGRFIPVRPDADRIHTCFLEYQPDMVLVYDVVHSRTGESWAMSVNSYPKLRLSFQRLKDLALSKGLSVFYEKQNRGMCSLAFRR